MCADSPHDTRQRRKISVSVNKGVYNKSTKIKSMVDEVLQSVANDITSDHDSVVVDHAIQCAMKQTPTWSRTQHREFAYAVSKRLGKTRMRLPLQSRLRPSELRLPTCLESTVPASVLSLGFQHPLFQHFADTNAYLVRVTRQLSNLTVKNTLVFYLNMLRYLPAPAINKSQSMASFLMEMTPLHMSVPTDPVKLLRLCMPTATVADIETAYIEYQTTPRMTKRPGLCLATVGRHMQWCVSLFGKGPTGVIFPSNWILSSRRGLHATIISKRHSHPDAGAARWLSLSQRTDGGGGGGGGGSHRVLCGGDCDISDDDDDDVHKENHNTQTNTGTDAQVFQDHEIAAMLSYHSGRPRNRSMLGILFSTGVRLCGLLSLKTSAVFESPMPISTGTFDAVVVRDYARTIEKRGVIRRLPLAPFVKQALTEYYIQELAELRTRTPSPYLFPSARYANGHLSGNEVRRMFVDTCSAVGVPQSRRHVHATRHTCATRLHRSGFTLQQVADFLGHMTVETTRQVYVHLSEEEKLRAMRIPWAALLPTENTHPNSPAHLPTDKNSLVSLCSGGNHCVPSDDQQQQQDQGQKNILAILVRDFSSKDDQPTESCKRTREENEEQHNGGMDKVSSVHILRFTRGTKARTTGVPFSSDTTSLVCEH